MQERVDDDAGIGVENIWANDPWKRLGNHASRRGFDRPLDAVLPVSGTPIAVSLTELLQELDAS